MIPKVVTSQTDFSGGEPDSALVRSDADPLFKIGARQMRNWRILNSKKPANRPGRRAHIYETGRTDHVRVAPDYLYHLVFGDGTLRIYDPDDTLVFNQASMPWAPSTVQDIVWDIYRYDVYICFPDMQPQVLSWNPVTLVWTMAAFAERTVGNQKRTPFYRLSPQNITMLPGARTGSGVTATFSSGMNLVAGHVGTRMRYCNCQVLITAVASPTSATITIEEDLPISMDATVSSASITGSINVGDEIVGSVTGAHGIVTSYNSGTQAINIQLIAPSPQFNGTTDTCVGPAGTFATTGFSVAAPKAVTVWDDEVINSFRGWPESVCIDQNRLIFSNLPGVPSGIAWSAIGLAADLYPGASPSDAIFELAPGKSLVLYVTPGVEGSEFVICDNAIYYIPISETNPLVPGSVAFKTISGNGAQRVQPRRVKEQIVYIGAGEATTIMALVAIGSYSRPYEARPISDNHAHLFNDPVCIAAPTADTTYPEDYVFVVNSDGTVAVGKYEIENGQIKSVGWVPWDGDGLVKWASSFGAEVIFWTVYTVNGSEVSVIEEVDDTVWVDAAFYVNVTAPATFAPAVGKGPLWWLAGGQVDLYDIATANRPRMMGTYDVDADGNIVAQGNAGEDLSSATLVAGFGWDATLEPFCPNIGSGEDKQQRMRKRAVAMFGVSFQNSTGFRIDRLYSGLLGANLPDKGDVMATRRIATWNMDDDAASAPPLREGFEFTRPSGRSYDPRNAIVKDTLGPLTITEIAQEVTV